MNAQELRTKMRNRRRALAPEDVKALSQALCARIRQCAAYQNAKNVMLYWPIRGEISPLALLADGKCFCLPRVEGPGRMTARLFTGEADLECDAMGIAAPKETAQIVDPAQIDLVIVPGVAFTAAMERVGQGGGYYDRFLPGTQACRMGVAYDFQMQNRVVQQAHDARMDIVITPTKTWGGYKHGYESNEGD